MGVTQSCHCLPVGESKQNTHVSSDCLICPVKAPCLYTISHWIWLCPTDLAGQGFDIHILAWDSSFLFYLNKNLYIYWVCFKDFFAWAQLLRYNDWLGGRSTEWRWGIFSVDIYISLLFLNTFVNFFIFCLFCFFDFYLNLLHLYFNCLLCIGRRKETFLRLI